MSLNSLCGLWQRRNNCDTYEGAVTTKQSSEEADIEVACARARMRTQLALVTHFTVNKLLIITIGSLNLNTSCVQATI